MNNVERMIAGLRCCAANKNVCAAVECPLFELCQANKINPLLVAAEMMEALKVQKEAAENGLADLEAKLAELLCRVTGGRFSKTTYSIEEMKRFADDFLQEECEKCEEMEQVKRERDEWERRAKDAEIQHRTEYCEDAQYDCVALGKARKELAEVERERDAAVADLNKAQAMACYVCKHYYQIEPGRRKYGCKVFGDHWFDDDDDGAIFCGHFEWRGVQEGER